MKNKIAEIYGKRRWGVWWEGIEQKQEVLQFADTILSLLRQNGWLHKDDPVEGLQVTRECKSSYAMDYPACKKICADSAPCRNKVVATSSLTLGEYVEMGRGMVSQLINGHPVEACPQCGSESGCNIDCNTCMYIYRWIKDNIKVLTTKSGGVVSVKEGE